MKSPFRHLELLRLLAVPFLFSLAAVCALTGCSREATSPTALLAAKAPATVATTGPAAAPRAAAVAAQDGGEAPATTVEVAFGGSSLTLWPYTGASFDGTPSDPVNLLFVGAADPVAIRDALLSLDGNRGAAGFPPVAPFDATWSDAIGDAQTNWSAGEGWSGSAIQLQLGAYAPLRVHLRLFRTAAPFPGGGTWTVGAAHFEVLIPGTADHQVLSWELAKQVVVADLARSGLLDATTPMAPSGAIHAAPTFREIPPFLYNGLPAELIALIGGPPAPVSAGVGIPTDGQAMVLHLARRAARAGGRTQGFTMTYDQVIPRPLCSEGPGDWIHVAGPVRFDKTTTVDAAGALTYESRYSGRLTAVPVDITQDPPQAIGEPFEAQVSEMQRGAVDARGSQVMALTRRLVPGAGGSEFTTTQLRVATDGANRCETQARCR